MYACINVYMYVPMLACILIHIDVVKNCYLLVQCLVLLLKQIQKVYHCLALFECYCNLFQHYKAVDSVKQEFMNIIS